MKILKVSKAEKSKAVLILADKTYSPEPEFFSKKEIAYINQELQNEDFVAINQMSRFCYILTVDSEKEADIYKSKEKLRKEGYNISRHINKKETEILTIRNLLKDNRYMLSLVEGIALSNYRFLKYFSNPENKRSSLNTLEIICNSTTSRELQNLNNLVLGVEICKNLINEPPCKLSSVQLAQEIKKLSPKTGLKVEVFDKSRIEALKMGGLLAVNRGSVEPPTFTTIEWKPEKTVNTNPLVLVGKGIVYDTGGYSLKPTSSMDTMKADMAGAAAVTGVMYALAKSKIPAWVVALVPSTDNRIDGNAYVPGDVVKMHDNTTVEVLNTDAEGRMILADALSYSKRYNPALVIDIATLTGSASAAVGPHATACMGNNPDAIEKLKTAGFETYERVIEFPLWSEYGELIKSDIADIKNVGGKSAGMITAGKFLEHFTDYPWIHIDIAGSAFSKTTESYKGKGATGYGVRLLYDFVQKYFDIR